MNGIVFTPRFSLTIERGDNERPVGRRWAPVWAWWMISPIRGMFFLDQPSGHIRHHSGNRNEVIDAEPYLACVAGGAVRARQYHEINAAHCSSDKFGCAFGPHFIFHGHESPPQKSDAAASDVISQVSPFPEAEASGRAVSSVGAHPTGGTVGFDQSEGVAA